MPIALDELEPTLVYRDGEFIHVDKQTGEKLSDDDVEQYNRYFGYAGYDEMHDEAMECGDE